MLTKVIVYGTEEFMEKFSNFRIENKIFPIMPAMPETLFSFANETSLIGVFSEIDAKKIVEWLKENNCVEDKEKT